MMDMSKFDSIHSSKIMEDLSVILLPEELHLVKLLIEGVELAVKVCTNVGKNSRQILGTPQGDCIGPTFFTSYLTMALREAKNGPNELDDCTYYVNSNNGPPITPKEVDDHSYSISRDIGTVIELQYIMEVLVNW